MLPPNAPPLGATIETDLAEHGFALLRGAMALRAQAGASELTSKAFERAANAFEALVRNGDPEAADRGFRRTIAAAAYHLAGFSAVAYSLFNETADDLNASPGETAMMRLILRDLGRLRGFVRDWLNDEAHGDEQIAEALPGEDAGCRRGAVDHPQHDDLPGPGAFFDFALETGEAGADRERAGLLATAVSLADNAGECAAVVDHQSLPASDRRPMAAFVAPEPADRAARGRRRKNIPTCGGCSSARSMPARTPRLSYGRRSAKRRAVRRTSRTTWSSPCPPAPARRASRRSPR